MFVLYAVAGVLASVVTPVATAALMISVGVDAAARLGADEFAFLLAVTFASATSFMTPVGYQTNLVVYGPGGYEVDGSVPASESPLLRPVSPYPGWAFSRGIAYSLV